MKKLFFLALAFRLGLFGLAWIFHQDTSFFQSPDSKHYLALAQNLINSRTFEVGGVPEVFRVPGYPVFLTLGLLAKSVTAVTVLLQIFLSCLTVCALVLLAKELGSNSDQAKKAGLLLAVEPLSVIFSVYLLSETLFLFFLVCSFLCLFKALREQKNGLLFLGGVSLLLAVFVRPSILYLPWILLGFLWLFKKRSWLELSRVFLFFVLPFLIGVSLWSWRNHQVADYRGYAAVIPYNLYLYQAAQVKAVQEKRSFAQVSQELKSEVVERGRQEGWLKGRVYHQMGQNAREILLASPWLAMKLHLRGVFQTLLDPGSVDLLKVLGFYKEGGGLLSKSSDEGWLSLMRYLYKKQPLIFWVSGVLELVLLTYLFLAFRGALFNTKSLGLILIISFYFLFLSGGGNSVARLRHPAMALICILAGRHLSRSNN